MKRTKLWYTIFVCLVWHDLCTTIRESEIGCERLGVICVQSITRGAAGYGTAGGGDELCVWYTAIDCSTGKAPGRTDIRELIRSYQQPFERSQKQSP
jgi:hypothetical protein